MKLRLHMRGLPAPRQEGGDLRQITQEVRAGLLEASVNSVGAGKWQLAVSSEAELRTLGWMAS